MVEEAVVVLVTQHQTLGVVSPQVVKENLHLMMIPIYHQVMVQQDQSQMLDILLLVAVVDLDLLVLQLNQSVVVVLAEVLLMDHLVRLTPVVVAVVVRMASVLDMVVAVLEDSFKDSPELFQLEHTQLQLVLEQQRKTLTQGQVLMAS
tara:strand:- start:83 stop:526 length:444 start_codon:yes stop_codon:yes gene_type:complete